MTEIRLIIQFAKQQKYIKQNIQIAVGLKQFQSETQMSERKSLNQFPLLLFKSQYFSVGVLKVNDWTFKSDLKGKKISFYYVTQI